MSAASSLAHQRSIYDETAYNLVVLVHTHDADPVESVRYFVEDAQVDGLIFAHTTPQDPRVHYLMEHGVPFVTHGRTKLKERHAYFDFDNYAMTKRAVERLVKKGRRRLAMVSSTPHLTCAEHFSGGFFDGVKESGVEGMLIPGSFPARGPGEVPRGGATARDAHSACRTGSSAASRPQRSGLSPAFRRVGSSSGATSTSSPRARPTSSITSTPPIDSFLEDLVLAGETLAHFLMKRIHGVPVEELQAVDQPKLCVRA